MAVSSCEVFVQTTSILILACEHLQLGERGTLLTDQVFSRKVLVFLSKPIGDSNIHTYSQK